MTKCIKLQRRWYKLFIILFIISLTFVVIGVILYKRNRPVDSIREYVLANKDKYNLTENQVEEVVSKFEYNLKPDLLDKSKEEIYQTDKMKIENEFILGLRKMDGIDINRFKERYNMDIRSVKGVNELIESKQLVLTENNLFIHPDYWYLANTILINFIDWYWHV